MRPKKHFLIIDADSVHGSILRYVLRVNGFEATYASCPEEAAPLMALTHIDLVVGVWPIGASFAALAHAAQIPSLLICADWLVTPADAVANAIMLAPLCTTADVIERVKYMTARKRGPRKGSKRMPVSETRVGEAAIA